ncbi:MAG: hypothetical protein PVI86_04305 [Phycisphaerae bacterium]|jgi:hypothetical protein
MNQSGIVSGKTRSFLVRTLESPRKRCYAGAVCLLLTVLMGAGSARADGTEELGPPGIAISPGSGIVSAGIGLGAPGVVRASRVAGVPGIQIDVPGNRVNQALLYWSGEGSPEGDDEVTVDNGGGPVVVTGTLIGGPTEFFSTIGFGKVYLTTFRADISDLVGPGANTVVIAGLDYGFSNSGAGVFVIYDDGTSDDIDIRDGQDLAFARFLPPLDTTVSQDFVFAPSANGRTAELRLFFGSVGTIELRPNLIRVIVEGGGVFEYPNVLASVDGPLWDTVRLSVPVPAESTSLTIEALSVEDGTHLPASMNWIAASMYLDTPGPCEFVDCDDDDVCTDDFCNPETGECEYTDVDCDDGNACTNDRCDPIDGCINEDITPTCDDGVECTVDGCDPAIGCTNVPDDTVCNDEDACTSDTCDAVAGCVNTDISDECNDNNVCTDDRCDPVEGCVYEDNTQECDDGVECTVDGCDPVSGCTNAPDNTLCNDENACTTDTCDPVEGCVYVDISNQCDDGNVCTDDRCDPVEGCVYEDVSAICADTIACTLDLCDPDDGCINTPDDTLCDDSDACTSNRCDAAVGCVYEDISDTCVDGNVCTLDRCDPIEGCVYDDISDDCADAIECTVDACDPVTGCSNTPDDTLCDDGNACTEDTCDPAEGCVYVDISASCDDSNACTADRCDPAVGCVNDDISSTCNDNVACTNDRCDPATGCVNTPDDTLCDDNDDCTRDVCTITGCQHHDNFLCQACCIDDACEDITVDDCDALGGIPQGAGTTCATVICTGCGNNIRDPGEECDGTDDDLCPGECLPSCNCGFIDVPTVSTWGTIVLALTLLAWSKVAFGRRRRRGLV